MQCAKSKWLLLSIACECKFIGFFHFILLCPNSIQSLPSSTVPWMQNEGSFCCQKFPFLIHMKKMWVYIIVISVRLIASWVSGAVKTETFVILFNTINVINVKLCTMVVPLIELYLLMSLSVMLLGWGIVEVPLNIFIGQINGRLARPPVRRKWEWTAVFNNWCGFFLVLPSVCYPCDFSWLVRCSKLN